MQKAQDILRRTGVIVILIGILEFGLGFIGARQGTFRIHVLDIVLGTIIVFGNLRAASAIRWLACFAILPAGLLLVASIVLLPASLLLAQLRFISVPLFAEYGGQFLALATLLYMMRKLGSAPVLAARAAAGRKPRDMRIPLAMGGILAVGAVFLMAKGLYGEDAAKARALAAARMGPGYEYFTSHINFQYGAKKQVQALVQVWNDRELRAVPVHWDK